MNGMVRPARREDCETISRFIRELAEYEKMPEQVKLSVRDLEEDLFGPSPWAVANVACIPTADGGESVVGYVLYFFMFDPTAMERVAYMEDLYVQPQHRHRGLGLALWKSVAKHGLEKRCDVLNWTVLDWNEPSIRFYVKQGAKNISVTRGYQRLRFTADLIEKIAAGEA